MPVSIDQARPQSLPIFRPASGDDIPRRNGTSENRVFVLHLIHARVNKALLISRCPGDE